MYMTLTYDQMTEKMHQQKEHTIKCKCGHSVIVVPTLPKKMCTWCGNWVFRNKKEEFKYRLMEKIHKC